MRIQCGYGTKKLLLLHLVRKTDDTMTELPDIDKNMVVKNFGIDA